MLRLFILVILVYAVGCNHPHPNSTASEITGPANCTFSNNRSSGDSTRSAYNNTRGALLATRFHSLDELKSVIRIEYFNNNAIDDSVVHAGSWIRVTHCTGSGEVISVLEAGVSQNDIYKAKYGKSFWDRLNLVLRSPYAIRNRKDLERIYTLSRWRPEWFGEGDLAFFDIAKATAANINTPDAFQNSRDSTEKGYLNSFNHLTAQAFITSCFSEEIADFIADAHERYSHPRLITGKFTQAQINDLAEGPVDNYVDIINNEWGQELGKQLKQKYNITRETNWTPELLTNYLNDLQSYYSWAFQIGFKPFRTDDEDVLRFSKKINAVMKGRLGKIS